MQGQVSIPPEIRNAYYPDGIASQTSIPGGETNLTFMIVDGKGRRTILQRLSRIYDSRVGEDYEVVAAHLRGMGWEMAGAVKATDGIAYMSDHADWLWRAFDYIESTPGSDLEGDLEASAALGRLLGKLHRSLSSLDYKPKFSRAAPHGRHYQPERLKALLPRISDRGNRALAEEMITLSGRETIGEEPSQIIHADPRIGNVLFRDGQPFTFIDWDGYRLDNPVVDVGDLLQSTAGEVLTKGAGSCSARQLYPILEAYYEALGAGPGKAAFIQQGLAAARVIALDLGMRHLIDSVEDKYFVWDGRLFDSRFEFNVSCARRQRSVYEVLSGA